MNLNELRRQILDRQNSWQKSSMQSYTLTYLGLKEENK